MAQLLEVAESPIDLPLLILTLVVLDNDLELNETSNGPNELGHSDGERAARLSLVKLTESSLHASLHVVIYKLEVA